MSRGFPSVPLVFVPPCVKRVRIGIYQHDSATRLQQLAKMLERVDRIVEMPEDAYQTNMLRNPRLGLVAYAPVGSVKAGEALATTGGGGRTQACGTCHGADMRGTPVAPPLAPMPLELAPAR